MTALATASRTEEVPSTAGIEQMERTAFREKRTLGLVTKPLLIGQAPGPNTQPQYPLFPLPKTSAGGRLQQMTGLTVRQYLRTFDRMNLLQKFPGSNLQGDKWPMREARAAAGAVQPLLRGRAVVLVGRNVAQAFGFEQSSHYEFLRWFRCEEFDYHFSIIPHTSGRNHWYNDPINRSRIRGFWSEFMSALSLEQPN